MKNQTPEQILQDLHDCMYNFGDFYDYDEGKMAALEDVLIKIEDVIKKTEDVIKKRGAVE